MIGFLLPSQDEPLFDHHYGYFVPDPITTWPSGTDFPALVERVFANRLLSVGHDKRAKGLRATIAAGCPPKQLDRLRTYERCRQHYCE